MTFCDVPRASNQSGMAAAAPVPDPRSGEVQTARVIYKINSNTSARMRGRLVLNGAIEIRDSYGEISGAHVSETTILWPQTMVPLTAGETVELQGCFRAQDGYFTADY